MIPIPFLHLFLLLLFPLILPSQGTQTTCFPAPRALPNLFHCRELASAIAWLAHRPGEDGLKSWGRRLPTAAETENLPKTYYIVGAVLPTTCAVQVDVDRTDPLAVDAFWQRDVAASVETVVDRCLLRRRLVGLDYPGEAEHVYVMILRTDVPIQLEFPPAHDVQNVTLPGDAGVLRIVTGHSVIYGAGGSRGNSSWSLINYQ